jgi:predicted HicB family RNase H-like nuclease
MSNMMRYKGYDGSVTYSNEDKVFFGKLESIRDLVSFEGTDVESLEKSFQEAVDDYLETCAAEGREPDKPYKGQFNVRINPEIHRGLALVAHEINDGNLNATVEAALQEYVSSYGHYLIVNTHTEKTKSGRLQKPKKAAKPIRKKTDGREREHA